MKRTRGAGPRYAAGWGQGRQRVGCYCAVDTDQDGVMPEHLLHDLEAFDAALRQHPRLLVFKHRPACQISGRARGEYEQWKTELPDAPTLFVDVIAERMTARGIAERTGVRHESPRRSCSNEAR